MDAATQTCRRASISVRHLAVRNRLFIEGTNPMSLPPGRDPAPSPANYIIAVKVERKLERNADRIALDWTIRDPKGREIAHIGQANAVPPGNLDHYWGGRAYDAALAAARALLPIIRNLPPEPLP